MIEVGSHIISSDVEEIIKTLKEQLAVNGIQRFHKNIDTPNNLMVCCPFHKDGQEKKPSMGILKSDGTCHCFACDWTGSLSEMISNCFGYDDLGIYGSKWLIKHFLTIEVEQREDIDLNLNRKTVSNNRNNNKKYVSEEELDSYRYYHKYWEKRKITSEWLIELFDLGYDKKTDCITFPVRDIYGNCLFVAKRSVKTKFFNYPEGVEKPLYGLYELIKHVPINVYHGESFFPDVIVCESMIDALTCWQYGSLAVALNGLGNELQFKQLRELPARKIILATDMDERGLQARDRIKKALKNKIVTEYKWDVNVAKDINDMSKDYFYSLAEYMS